MNKFFVLAVASLLAIGSASAMAADTLTYTYAGVQGVDAVGSAPQYGLSGVGSVDLTHGVFVRGSDTELVNGKVHVNDAVAGLGYHYDFSPRLSVYGLLSGLRNQYAVNSTHYGADGEVGIRLSPLKNVELGVALDQTRYNFTNSTETHASFVKATVGYQVASNLEVVGGYVHDNNDADHTFTAGVKILL
jgi:hypothetical protein